jgi:hypothetical protein
MKQLTIDYTNLKLNFVSEEQEKIVIDNSRIKIVNGCAGGRKTDSLIKCGIYYIMKGLNVLFLTKISSVTDEITKRMTKDYSVVFQKSASHFVGKIAIEDTEDMTKFGWCSVANYDSFIDKQLRKYKIPFEGEAFNQKVHQLHANLNIMNDGLVMKNDQKVDVILIDEVQDFDKLRVVFTTDLFNHFKDLIGVFVGDTLQTVFLQSIMDDSFSMNHLKSNLQCKYFELSKCYRCPKAQIDFVNKVMGPYQEKYCINAITSNNHNMIDKPVIFQHHSVHKEYERADLCNRVIYIIDYVLNNDSTVTPDDIVVVMNKTNSNAVFEKLLVEINGYYKKRFNCKNYEHVIHYKTKNHEGRKTIDWTVGENKTKFISIHGIKGKGQKVVILLGMSEKSIPLVEWLFKTEELISQSVMNVALTRSEKYLFVGVNSIPSRYINDQVCDIQKNKMAYCSWNSETYNNDETSDFYKNLLIGFEKFERFDFITDKYTKEIVSTPSKSIMAIKEDVVQEYHISDCISNAFQLMDDEIMVKEKFGKRMFHKNDMNIVERSILGIMCELVVQRYCRIRTNNWSYDNKFLLNYWNNKEQNYYFTNNQSLLNLAFDLKINNDVKSPEKWYPKFEIIKQKSKHIKILREDLSKITSPMYILDKIFEKINLQHLLSIYFSNIKNEEVKTYIFWNLALFFSALSGNYKMNSVMLYINSFNKDISQLHENTKHYCETYLLNQNLNTYSLTFQKEINVLKNIEDPKILSQINPDLLKQQVFKTKMLKNKETKEKELKEVKVKPKYTYGFMGISDIVQENIHDKTAILHEIKCISMSDAAKVKTWIFQSILYTYLLKKLNRKIQNQVEKIIIVNLLSGYKWEFDMTKITIKYRDMITYIMKQKQFPDLLIDHFLETI